MSSKALKQGRESLETLWRQGLSGAGLLAEQTRLVDRCLIDWFRGCPEAGEGVSLVCLGGYGRKELFPFSDIDLMLVHDNLSEERLDAVASAVFYPLWDAGLDVGHGVRTVDACIADAKDDFFFQVAMLDARFLVGDQTLFDHLNSRFFQECIDGKRQEFLQRMEEARQFRLDRFGRHTYMLEPHIKESRGGLRDVQAMLWTARAVFGIDRPEAMEDAGLLDEKERTTFVAAHENLIRIRNRLHYLAGRRNDQLFFEHQEEMAKALGYRQGGGLLAVERFMRDVHDSMRTVTVTVDLFFEHAREVLGLAPVGHLAMADRRIEDGIEIRLGRVHLTDPEGLASKPHRIMRLCAVAARYDLPIHHRAKKILQNSVGLIDDRVRRSKRMSRVFCDLLSQPGAAGVLSVMLETGILAAYIPEFEPLRSLAQHDAYHVNTVDRHLIGAVAELNRLKSMERPIAEQVASSHVLALATLLHDVGKGQGQGHAERGGRVVAQIGSRMGLDAAEIECLVFLVSQHLYLMHTALRRDLEDESLILRVARQIKDPERLAMLYLLTVADARATGPTVWNEWKAALLLELYLKVAHLLERSDFYEPEPDQQPAAAWMLGKIRQQLGDAGHTALEGLPDDYLVNFSPEDVCRHIRLRDELQEKSLILETGEEAPGCWSLLIMTTDRPGLLSKICGVLALHNLKILAAQIFTWKDGTVVDSLSITSAVNGHYQEQDWRLLRDDLELAVGNRLGLDYRLHKKLAPLSRGKLAPVSRQPARVEIDNESSQWCTIVEIYAADRVGLLYEITRTLADFGMNILRAIIGSKADQVVDVFYVQDSGGNKVADPFFLDEIRHGLMHVATHESRDRQERHR